MRSTLEFTIGEVESVTVYCMGTLEEYTSPSMGAYGVIVGGVASTVKFCIAVW